jgi:hypothetical protein
LNTSRNTWLNALHRAAVRTRDSSFATVGIRPSLREGRASVKERSQQEWSQQAACGTPGGVHGAEPSLAWRGGGSCWPVQ